MELTIKNIFKGVFIAIILTVALLLIFSAVLAYTDVNENTKTPVIIVVTGISILLGSSIGNMKIKKNGILNGGLIGRILYSNFIFNFKYFKLEIWLKSTKPDYDISWNIFWNIRRNNWSK